MLINLSPRRIITLFGAVLFSVVLLLTFTGQAHASGAYPPSTPSSTISSHDSSASSGATSTPQGPGASSRGEASTGFDSLAAAGIAVILIGGGALLLTFGRRRRETR